VFPHAVPPYWSGVVTSLVFSFNPDPHVVLHGPQSVQSPSTQSTGQGCVLHASSFVYTFGSARSMLAPPSEQLPPYSAGVMVRVRVDVPPPHGSLQAPASLQSEITQSTGSCVGLGVGLGVGASVGETVGKAVGIGVGKDVGASVGASVGIAVGIDVGNGVGEAVVGTGVGEGVGQAIKLHV